MRDKSAADFLDRRRFLGAAGLAGAGAVLAAMPAVADEAKPDPLITEVQDWSRYLGDGDGQAALWISLEVRSM
jgi:sulfane dehydrogenase subunit SoxC